MTQVVFVQFEQAWEDWNTDIVCPMYPNMWKITEYAKSGKQRPFIMCVSMPMPRGIVMVTSKTFGMLFMTVQICKGGFIWDFMDQRV